MCAAGLVTAWVWHHACTLDLFLQQSLLCAAAPGYADCSVQCTSHPRKCIGDQFALFEAIVALAMLVRRFDFEVAPDAPEVSMTTGEGFPLLPTACVA